MGIRTPVADPGNDLCQLDIFDLDRNQVLSVVMPAAKKSVAAKIQDEHQRILKLIGDADPYLGKTTIGFKEVLKAHFLLAEYFAATGEGLGGLGPRSLNLLHSALSRQTSAFGGIPHWNDRLQSCASLMYGLILNHPFHDANKRTAFLTAMLHLQKIGRTPTCGGEEFEELTVSIANHTLSKYDFYERMPGVRDDKDVEAVAFFLKRNTRNIDLGNKSITYNDLKRIIRRYGLTLLNPQRNRIDLIRTHREDGYPLIEPKRIGKIGFHSWSIQVPKSELHVLRSVANLDVEHGYDSQSFFNGVEGPLQLIKKYREPLRRLAYR